MRQVNLVSLYLWGQLLSDRQLGRERSGEAGQSRVTVPMGAAAL